MIEAMVAALILAFAAAALFETIGVGAHTDRASALRLRAMLVAESVLAGAGHAAPLAESVQEGRSTGLVWRLDTRSAALDGESDIDPVTFVTVSVRAEGDSRPLVTLHSLRVGA